jgi:hypothetical protein
MEINKKALNILLKHDILEPNTTSEEDLRYAINEKYMFEPFYQTHDEAMESAFIEFNKCKKKHITDLFLASLSSSRLDWRNGLPAYAIMRVYPRHELSSNGYNCLVCPSINQGQINFTNTNKMRFEKGGLYNGNIYDLYFILEQHNQLCDVEPINDDYRIFKNIIDVINNAEEDDGPSKIQKEIGKIKGFTSNKYQRAGLLETLGFCSILETSRHKGFLYEYINLASAPRFRHSSDWLYPVDWWKGKDGINQEAFMFWFGDYKELGMRHGLVNYYGGIDLE